MKIFISHQKADSILALELSNRLKFTHGIDTYLDVIDAYLGLKASWLGDHIKGELGKCTQLLAVVSPATVNSWWVPWEIGVATEKDFPLATFSGNFSSLPDYLKKWPYLKSLSDLDKYATASKTTNIRFLAQKGYIMESVNRSNTTAEFFRTLKTSLGQ